MKTIVLTGANSGIGYCAASQLAAAGHRLVMVCRNQERAEQARQSIIQGTGNKDIHLELADMSEMRQVRAFAQRAGREYGAVDCLINNAADFDLSRKSPAFSREGIETQFAANTLGPYFLTKLLLPVLRQSADARILNISTQGLVLYPNITFDFENVDAHKGYHPAKVYYQTKLALLMHSLYLRNRLADSNVSVHAIRVTNVKIDMARYSNIAAPLKAMYRVKSLFSISPEAMAEAYAALAVGERRSGFCYDEKMREVSCNRGAYDASAQQRLVDLCEDLLP